MGVLDTVGRVHDVAAMRQANDIKASEDVDIYGYLREKKYLKDKHIRKAGDPRLLPFTEPYQVAAYKLRVPWTRTNKAVMVQTAGCNLDCDFCFVGDETIVETTTDELWSDYWHEYCCNAENPSPIFRISGGEPFLQQEFVANLVRCMLRRRITSNSCYIGDTGVYVWVNTNLTIEPCDDLLESLSDERVGVVGSFKPVAAPEKFDTQLDVACRLIDAGVDTYFYYPCSLDEEDREVLLDGEWSDRWVDLTLKWSAEFLSHLHAGTRHLGSFYASRLNPIGIGYHYETVGKPEVFTTASQIKRNFFLGLQKKFIALECGVEYWWLPAYQIDVREGVG